MTAPAAPRIPAPLPLPDSLQWLPAQGRAEQLMILLHGWGARAEDMAPTALALRHEFPQAALLAPQGFQPAASGLAGRQWFNPELPAPAAGGAGAADAADAAVHQATGQTASQAADLAAALPRLADWLHAAQAATGLGPAATALVGFSQGAMLALALVQQHDGIAGRVLSFAGRYVTLPAHALAETTLHFFHGADDDVIPADQTRHAVARLAALQGDATVDIAQGIGHELSPVLLQCAVQRLRTHIPHRTWVAALGAVPGLADRQRDDGSR